MRNPRVTVERFVRPIVLGMLHIRICQAKGSDITGSKTKKIYRYYVDALAVRPRALTANASI